MPAIRQSWTALITKMQRWWLTWLFILPAVVLLFVSLSYQAASQIAQNRYAKEISAILPSGANLQVLYPERLRREQNLSPEQMLSIQINGDLTQTYTITLSFESSLLLTDHEGHPLTEPHTYTVNSATSVAKVLGLRPAPLKNEQSTSADFSIQLSTPSDPTLVLESRSLTLETFQQARWRFFWALLLRDTALPLSLAFALIGWGLDYRKKQGERADNERSERIQTARAMLTTNPLKALRETLRLEEEAGREGVRELRTQLQMPQMQEALLREANHLVLSGTDSAAARIHEILTLIERLYQDEEEASSRLGTLCKVFQTESSIVAPFQATLEDVITAALQLWELYDENVRQLVVHCLVWVMEHGGRSLLERRFETGQRNYLRLRSDSRLKTIAPDRTLTHHFPRLQTTPANPVESALAEWLNASALTENPFGSEIATQDRLLSQSWVNPQDWDQIERPSNLLIFGESEYDCTAAVNQLYVQLVQQERTFPVWLLPPDTYTMDPHLSYVRQGAKALGQAWVNFLILNSHTLFEMPIPEQADLARLLTWCAGTSENILVWLQQAGLSNDALGQALTRQFKKVLGSSVLPPPKQEEITFWLRLRPPGLTHTYLLSNTAATSIAQITSWFDKVNHFDHLSIWLKCFLLDLEAAPKSKANTVTLTWKDEQLKAMLITRLQRCSRGKYNSFAQLFAPQPLEQADDWLAACSEGSLGRMLQLGNAVFRTRLLQPVLDGYLEEDDLKTVLKRENTYDEPIP